MTFDPRRPRPLRPVVSPSEIDQKLRELATATCEPLTPWEEEFVASVTEQRARSGTSSERQDDIVERLYKQKVLGDYSKNRRYE